MKQKHDATEGEQQQQRSRSRTPSAGAQALNSLGDRLGDIFEAMAKTDVADCNYGKTSYTVPPSPVRRAAAIKMVEADETIDDDTVVTVTQMF